LIAVLYIGYFVLEGFDFGVGILLPFLGKTDLKRRVMINTIGPHWDGNEVWLLTAGGATFAAFPQWYATLFSGFYLPLFLIGAYPDGPLGGLAMALILSVLGLGLSFPIAILIGLALLSSFAWLRFAAQWWTRVIRGIPLLLIISGLTFAYR